MDLLRIDLQLCFALYDAQRAMGKAYAPLLAPLGLTYPQYLVLLCLWERDGQALVELGERLHLDSGTLSPLLKRLEAKGLLARRRDADDERRVLLALTPEGRRLKVRARGVPEALLRCAGLDAPAAGALRRKLQRLVHTLHTQESPA